MTKYTTIDHFGPIRIAIHNNAVMVSTNRASFPWKKMFNQVQIQWRIGFMEESIVVSKRDHAQKELEIYAWQLAVLDVGLVRKYFAMAPGQFLTTSILPRIEVIQSNGSSIVFLSENMDIIMEAFSWAERNALRTRDEFGLKDLLTQSVSLPEYIKKNGDNLFSNSLDEKYQLIYSNHADTKI